MKLFASKHVTGLFMFLYMLLRSKAFVQIGRSFCTYRSFVASLKPRMPLDSQVMDVWTEKFNRESTLLAAKSNRAKKKYAFSQHMVVSTSTT
jgi:hypothetical protein